VRQQAVNKPCKRCGSSVCELTGWPAGHASAADFARDHAPRPEGGTDGLPLLRDRLRRAHPCPAPSWAPLPLRTASLAARLEEGDGLAFDAELLPSQPLPSASLPFTPPPPPSAPGMKLSTSSILASLALATSLVSASSSNPSASTAPDLVARDPAPVLEDRTFGNLGDFLGDLLNPQNGQTCQSGLFYWGGLGGKCVKPSSSTAQPPTDTKSCPTGWSWSSQTK